MNEYYNLYPAREQLLSSGMFIRYNLYFLNPFILRGDSKISVCVLSK